MPLLLKDGRKMVKYHNGKGSTLDMIKRHEGERAKGAILNYMIRMTFHGEVGI